MTVEKHILEYLRNAEHKTRRKWEQKNQLDFSTSHPYHRYVSLMVSVDLQQITTQTIVEIVEPFLIDWGHMDRVLNDHRRAGWQQRLAETLRDYASFLESVRSLALGEQPLPSVRVAIECCYNAICRIVGPTCAGKVLHLVAPDYFPPWDGPIRKIVWSFPRIETSLKNGQRCGSGGGYFFFMLQIQDFLKTYPGAWEQLSREFHRTKVKMIDRYLWGNKEPLAWFGLCRTPG